MEEFEKEPVQEVAEQTAAPAEKKEKKLTKPQQWFCDARDILYILVGFMLIYVLFFRSVVVVGDSMFDTLAEGDRLLLVSNMVYQNPQRGDLIVASKDSFRGGECIIKRVIATEGQKVDIDFTTGTVYVDDVALEEPYLYSGTYRPEGMQFPLTVDEGCIFVMGDNRMDSKDSRDPEIGLLDQREILGMVIFRLWPGTGSSDHPIDFELGRIGVVE